MGGEARHVRHLISFQGKFWSFFWVRSVGVVFGQDWILHAWELLTVFFFFFFFFFWGGGGGVFYNIELVYKKGGFFFFFFFFWWWLLGYLVQSGLGYITGGIEVVDF